MHVLTPQGISTIQVPDELPTLLRDFTKDVIRTQPEDLVRYAAAYFAALAGISLPDSSRGGAAAGGEKAAADAAAELAGSSDPEGNTSDATPVWRRLTDDTLAAAAAEQHGGAGTGTNCQIEAEAAAAAAWDVNERGCQYSVVPPAEHYVRRSSDIDASQAAEAGAAAATGAEVTHSTDFTAAPAAEPASAGSGAADASDLQADDPEDAADGAAVAAPAAPNAEDLPADADAEAEAEPSAGTENSGCVQADGVAAEDGPEAALVALAERLFAAADADGSGALDRKEFRNVIRSVELGLSTAEVRALMAEADENEDGFVDWREFLPALLPLLRTLQTAKEVEAEQQEAARTRAEAALRAEVPQEALEALMRELFRGADTDGSGALSRAEFKACLRSETAAGLRLTRQDINTLLTEVDTDGDGLVDYEEFIPVAFNLLVERLANTFLAASPTAASEAP